MAEFINFLIEEAFLSITLLILIILLAIDVIGGVTKKYTEVTTNEAVSLMDDDRLVILDVREKRERANGFIKNDIHIPTSQVKSNINTLNKNNKFLVYCRSGSRSAHICSLLSKNGFTKVNNLTGGFVAWQKANLPIIKNNK